MSNANKTSHWGEDFNADTEKSTYRWIIYFTNGKSIPGYSRKQERPEISDKVRLFKRKVVMLTKSKKGYFNPLICEKIEFYKRAIGELADYNNLLVTLYPTRYQLHENEKFNSNKNVISFLDTVYNMIRLGNIAQLDYRDIGYSKITEEKLFRLEAGRFKSVQELQAFSREMIIEGYPEVRVEHFQRSYKNNYL